MIQELTESHPVNTNATVLPSSVSYVIFSDWFIFIHLNKISYLLLNLTVIYVVKTVVIFIVPFVSRNIIFIWINPLPTIGSLVTNKLWRAMSSLFLVLWGRNQTYMILQSQIFYKSLFIHSIWNDNAWQFLPINDQFLINYSACSFSVSFI